MEEISSKLRRLRKALNYPKNASVLIALFYLIVGIAVVPYLCRQLPFSKFYAQSPAEDLEAVTTDNTERAREAFRSMRAMNDSGRLSLLKRSIQDPEFCFIVNSVTRHVSIYTLVQVVNALIPQILADQQSVFTIYNAEGQTHKEAMDLSLIVPVIMNSKAAIENTKSYDKQRVDYIFALEWCLQREAEYAIVFEDDALPSTNFIEHLRFVLNHRMDKHNEHWAVLKLFYPEKYQGWGNNWTVVIELIIVSTLGGLILTTIVSYGIQILNQFNCRVLKFKMTGTAPISFHFIVSTAFFVYLLISVGKPHYNTARKTSIHLTSVVQAPGCCAPANLYPKTHIEELVQYLHEIRCDKSFPIDLAIDKFVEDRSLKKLLVIPNMVKHIGFVSSLPGKRLKEAKHFRIS